jgi:predicted DNA-binding helix-hairpin-helix protein
LKKIGISLTRACYFIICAGNEMLRKELTPMQVKQQLLTLQNSKYQANFSSQMTLW